MGMATGDKNVQKIIEPERAVMLRKIFCLIVILFGAFTVYFGVTSALNAQAIVEAANQAQAAKNSETTFNVMAVIIMCGVLAATGQAKVYLGIASLTGKRQKVLNTVNIVNLILVIVAFVVIYNLNGQFMAVMIINLAISLVILCWLHAKLARYLREMLGELKKLTWMTGKDLLSHTVAVLVFVLIMAAMIWLLDLAFSSGFGELAKIKIG